MIFKKVSHILIAPAIALFFFSCSSSEDVLPEVGTMEFSFNGDYYVLDYPDAPLREDGNGYTEKAKYISVYRSVSVRTVHLLTSESPVSSSTS